MTKYIALNMLPNMYCGKYFFCVYAQHLTLRQADPWVPLVLLVMMTMTMVMMMFMAEVVVAMTAVTRDTAFLLSGSDETAHIAEGKMDTDAHLIKHRHAEEIKEQQRDDKGTPSTDLHQPSSQT